MKKHGVLFFFILITTNLFGQSEFDLKSFEFFNGDQDSVIHVKLVADLAQFRKEKYKDSTQNATWGFYISDTDSIDLKVKVSPRGEFRRNHCMVTPFKVNFKKKDFKNSSVAKHDKLKVVTHCRNSNAYEQNLIVEYIIYKNYQLLTDYSFKVKMLDIRYFDESKKKTKESKHYGFFIEDIDQVAERNNSVEIETKMLSFSYLDPYWMTVMDLFNFMLGNTDYSIPHLHNVKLVKSNDPSVMYPVTVPYDFDYSGIIDANYAVPNEKLGIKDVKQRLFRGVCLDDKKIYWQVRDLFLEKKGQIIAQYEENPLLEDLKKKQVISYIEEFYDILENDNRYKSYVIDACRN